MRLLGVMQQSGRVEAGIYLMGLLAGLAALFQVSRLEAADPNAGVGMELQVIAAVVIGGTSLMGGRGSVARTLFGVRMKPMTVASRRLIRPRCSSSHSRPD